jgi:general secretion pathway protein J
MGENILLQRFLQLSAINLNRQAGFTLMELLIAMSISAIIAVMAYQSVNEVTAVKLNTEKDVEAFEKLQRAIWWLEQDLTQLAPRAILDELGTELAAYQARYQQGVEFTRIAVYPSPYGVSGLVRIGYQLDNNTLYRIIWPVLDRAPDTQPKRLAILNKVESFHVKQLDENNTWQDEWPPLNTTKIALPKLIEIIIKIEKEGEIRRIFPGVEGLLESENTESDVEAGGSDES